MPSAIDNYKRKIAVELERRRRFAENYPSNEFDYDHSPVRVRPDLSMTPGTPHTKIILDDLDIFIIKKSRVSVVERDASLVADNKAVKAYQPVIQVAPATVTKKVPIESELNFVKVNNTFIIKQK